MSTGLQGIDEFQQAATDLITEFPRQVGPAAVGAGLQVMAAHIRKAAPRKTGHLRRSVGTSLLRRRDGAAGKAGFDVGKKRPRRVIGPHAHLYYLGTQNRYRIGSKGGRLKGIGGKYRSVEARIRRGGYTDAMAKHKRRTGRAPAHPGMPAVIASSIRPAMQAMTDRASQILDRLAQQGL